MRASLADQAPLLGAAPGIVGSATASLVTRLLATAAALALLLPAAAAAGILLRLLLLVAGIVSTTPLLLFAGAARRLLYSTLGMIQFLAPTLQFLLAVLFYGERFTAAHAIAFGAIWIALTCYVTALVRQPRLPAAPE